MDNGDKGRVTLYSSAAKDHPPYCATCAALYPDPQYYDHGWCTARDYASVAWTGGCDDLYIERKE